MTNKPPPPKRVPSVDDPTSAFPIGALSSLVDDQDDSQGTPSGNLRPAASSKGAEASEPGQAAGAVPVQMRLLGLSLLVGSVAAVLLAVAFAFTLWVAS